MAVSVEFIAEAGIIAFGNTIYRYKVYTLHIKVSHNMELISLRFNRDFVNDCLKRFTPLDDFIYFKESRRFIDIVVNTVLCFNGLVRIGVLVILNRLVNTAMTVTNLTVAVRTPGVNLTVLAQSNRVVFTRSYRDYFFYRITVQVCFNLNREVLLTFYINAAFNVRLHAVTELTVVI